MYKLPNTDHQSHHWHPEWEKQRDFKWTELMEAAKQRLIDLLYKGKNLGVYGLGNARTLEDFFHLSGIDYTNKQLTQAYQEAY